MRLSVAGAVALFVVVLLGCEQPTQQAAAGCGKDTDCKADRVCESGRCVSPPSLAAIVADTPPAGTATAAPAPLGLAKVRLNTEPDGVTVNEDGVEVCSSTPCDIIYKGADADPATQHHLTFARSGYRSEARAVRVADSPVAVKLIATR
jgi:hypothetical protein